MKGGFSTGALIKPTSASPSRREVFTMATSAIPRISLDTYLLDVLMPDLVGHDHQPSAFLVYLYLWRKTDGGSRTAEVRLREMAEGTGLSKRAVQDAVTRLTGRGLVEAERESVTSISVFSLRRPWAERATRKLDTEST
jgi:hypothetical protein